MLVSFLGLQGTDPTWYTAITGQLTPEQAKQLEDVFKLAVLLYILGLQGTDPTWYTVITGQLTPEQTKQLDDSGH